MKFIILCGVAIYFCFSIQNGKAQEDSLGSFRDSTVIDTSTTQTLGLQKKFLYQDNTGISKPARAALLSAAFPGLGQIYTKKWWYVRVPLIYGLGGFMGYLIHNDHKRYVELRDAHLYSLDNNPITEPDPKFSGYNAQSLRRNRDNYRRNRDYYVILSIGVYILNIAEAATMAHLNGFDVSDDLSFSVKPSFRVIQGVATGGFALEIPMSGLRKASWQRKHLQYFAY